MTQAARKYAYMEDFSVGQSFTSSPVTMTEADIIAYARQYDPQDFHTNPEKAKSTVFGAHVASGWHTAAVTMRLMLDAVPHIEGGMVGRTIEKLGWPRPVYPGDALTVTVEVLHMRPSASNPARGIGRIRVLTRNQKSEIVQEMEVVIFVPRQPG